MSYKLKNYSKATPKKWQMAGDLALVLIPVLVTIIEQSPLEPDVQLKVIFWMSSVLAIVKILTQFFNDEK